MIILHPYCINTHQAIIGTINRLTVGGRKKEKHKNFSFLLLLDSYFSGLKICNMVSKEHFILIYSYLSKRYFVSILSDSTDNAWFQ